MSSKTDVEVIIGGKVFTLSGYESEEYLQKVASYINNKINEYSKIPSFKKQPADICTESACNFNLPTTGVYGKACAHYLHASSACCVWRTYVLVYDK